MKLIALVWFVIAVGMVVRTWMRLAFDVTADWVTDSIDWE